MEGVGVLSNYGGKYLGDGQFEDIFAELDRRSAVLFVHPMSPPHWTEFAVNFPATALEYPFEVTRWLLQVVSSGILRRFKRLKVIAKHGGGTMPLLESSVATPAEMQSTLARKMDAADFRETLRGIYFDCTAATAEITFDAYKASVPPERRLFGSDHPFMTEQCVPPALAVLNDDRRITVQDRLQLDWSNPLSLFPRLGNLWQ